MALLEVLSRPVDMTNPPDVTGTVTDPSATAFTVVNGAENVEVTGTGFSYDEFGDPIAGIVTAIDWMPAFPSPTFDFVLSGFSWNFATHGGISDTGFLVDGTTLFGAGAEWAFWLNGNDTLLGSEQNDTLQGYAGNDTIIGNGGNDDLRGWSGADSLVGGSGNDALAGGAGNDTLLGGSGGDYLVGGAGNDFIDGGLIVDRFGYADLNTLSYRDETVGVTVNLSGITGDGSLGSGTATSTSIGTDTVRNVDYVMGGAGNDSIVGSSAAIFEMFQGFGGNDTINGGAITSAAASNRITYQNSSAGVQVNLATGIATGAATGTDTLSNFNQVRGSHHADSLTGSNRTDLTETFEGLGGIDTIDGAGGNDTVRYDQSSGGVNVDLAAGTANDGFGTTDTLQNIENVRGSGWNDTITGDDGNNQLEGQGGNDVLKGGGGNDTLLGGGGQDALFGGAGNDVIDGGAVTDRVNYTDLNFLNYGGETQAITVDLSGISGDGSTGSGTATGASIGTDTVSNVNFIVTGSGNDSIVGSSAEIFEQFDGGAGDDTIDGGAITSSAGSNRVTYQNAGAAVTVDLAAGTATGGGGTDTLVNINHVRGTSGYGDSLTGTDRNDTTEVFEGLGGNDTIDGAGGFDIVRYDSATGAVNIDLGAGTASGAHGSDTLSNIEGVYGGGADDVLTGGGTSGAIEFFRGNAGNDTIDGLTGIDRVDYTSSTSGANVDLAAGTAADGFGTTDILANIENVRGSESNDTIAGDVFDNRLEGMGGNDLLDGAEGNDTLLGGAGRDTLVGGAGDDVMDGGAITDHLNYEDLNFLNYAGESDAVAIDLSGITGDGSTGTGTATGVSIGTDTVANVNFIVGGSGNDSILGSTANIFEQFEGGAGNDTIDGGTIAGDASNRVTYQGAGAAVTVDLAAGTATGAATGDDVLANINYARGSAHDDVLTGSDRTDVTEVLEGGDGNDTINGAGGFDIARYDGNGAVTVNLAAGTATGARGDDVLSNIEGVYGGNSGDLLVGGNTANGATFTDGRIEVFRGNAGDDTIDGGVGMDRADYTSSTTGVSVDLGTGAAADGLGGVDTLRNIEGVRGSDFADTLVGSDRATADGYTEFFEGRAGNDVIDGRGGIDTVYYTTAPEGVWVDLTAGTADDGYGTTDTLSNIENVRGSQSSDMLVGSAANNLLEGLNGNDYLKGEGGNDTLNGGDGNDLLDGGAGNDNMVGGAGSDKFLGGTGNDTMTGGVITDRINFTDLNIADYSADALGVTVNLSGITGDGSVGAGTAAARSTLAGNIGTDSLTNINYIIGGSGADSIVGSGAMIFEMFDGGAGNDTINGGAIADSFVNANRVTYQSTGAAVNVNLGTGRATGTTIGTDTLININQVRGSAHADTIIGSDRTDLIESFEGRGGSDFIDGRGGYDIARYDLANAGPIHVDLATGTVTGPDGVDTLAGIDAVFGTSYDDTMVGGNVAVGGSAYISGMSENFRGGAGDDSIDGGAGFDRAEYTNAAAGVLVDLATGTASDGLGGTDTLVGIEGVRGSDFNDTLIGSDRATYDIDGYIEYFEGGRGDDLIQGAAGTDAAFYTTSTAGVNVDLQTGVALDGLGGTDTLEGIEAVRGSGFDDTIVGANGGTRLDGMAGNDQLTGGDGEDELEGGNGADQLFGGIGDDLLDGGTGADTMTGGAGDDTYVVDSLSDVIVETAGVDILDRVYLNLSAAGTYTLSAGVDDVEISEANPSSTLAINVVGNAEDNWMWGNAGNNILNGGAGLDRLDGGLGNDTLIGGAGSDTYIINVATDVVSETLTLAQGGGWDDVRVGFVGTYTLGANIDDASIIVGGNGSLIGNALDNWLDGNEGNNVLSGGLGDDYITSNGGNDTVDGGAGDDKAFLSGSYGDYTITRTDALTTVLNDGSQTIVLRGIERVEFDVDGIEMTLAELQTNVASPFNDTLVGDAGDDTINGLAGNDSLFGDAGNDSLVGGAGADTLDGGLGDDTMAGGTENDTYVVDSLGDVVVEAALAGTDTIRTDLASYSLADAANVENLAYTGIGSFHGTGTAAANVITGGNGDDTLDGGLGNDTLTGGSGDDTYVINAATDVIVEGAAGGSADSVVVAYTAAGTYTLGANLENASAAGSVVTNLVGNALDNTLEGNAANNVLAGGDGADTLIVSGGTDLLDGGNGTADAAIFSGNRADWSPVSRPNATDVRISNGTTVVTLRNVETFVFDDGVFTLAEFLENSLSVFNDSWQGTSGNDESGDALAGNDTLDGMEGNDTLNGGLGNDSMTGGTGDDTFYVNVATDVVVENLDEGVDQVNVAFSAIGTYALAANVENATITTALTGVNVVGNTLDNDLTGGNGNNILNGQGGNDTLDGGLGSDTLVGGAGDDLFVVNVATDIVSELASGGTDRVEVRYTAAGTYTMTANVEEAVVIASSTVAVNVNGNTLGNDITGHAGNNVLSGGDGNDILEGAGGNDVLNGGNGTDEAILKGQLGDYTVTRVSTAQTNFRHTDGSTVSLIGIENLVFYGADTADESDDVQMGLQGVLDLLGSPGNDTLKGTSGADTLDGGAGNDLLLGNEGNDTLGGGAGVDVLKGGAGDDLLQGGTSGDTYHFGAGGGNDVIRENDATALIVDTLVIDAESGNLAGGEVRLTRSSTDADDLVLTITSGDNAEIVDTLTIDEFFLNDLVSAAGRVEQIRFTDGNLTLSQAQILSELLKGTGSGDWIRGYAGNDNINGLEGNDSIAGAAGNDTLIGNWGDDALDGGAGADLLLGNLGLDTLVGGDGNDILDGGAAADDLGGDAGNDVLLGGAGDDALDGGAGADTLTGGAGNDTLTGGTEGATDADRFVLNSLTGTDEITDFTVGVDKIAINKSVFTAVTGAVSATPTTLAGLGTAFDYDAVTGALTYDADGGGAGAAVTVAQLAPGLTLAADFLIIG